MYKPISTTSARQTMILGFRLAKQLKGGEILSLVGDLGAGKTTFLKGLARGLKVKQHITSPTFVLMKIYPSKRRSIKKFVHVDCYRVAAKEFNNIGLGDYLGRPDTVVAIEWADKLKLKNHKVITIFFRHGKKDNERTIIWKSQTR
ncbi:MAG: tRNA (adenosine(37)-N6)-threonylcarbamoyltransferase complex ATPase subunit type 1 TsaE [Candidatus Kerfeldbacteria bacterium]|nr:tRNA (adenosine(37)-N6)-threonylcarbamoyltransferase complex ATPase subunit type 1 TsaE [Candidatus Kerfeldbacteria bacterium]